MQKPGFSISAISILSFILGAWLVFDGTRKLVIGYYTGEQTTGLGPWATIVTAIGVRPSDMAFPFLFLGVLWVVNGFVVLFEASARYERTIAISIVTLFYAIPGTIIGIVTITLSLRERRLAGPSKKQPASLLPLSEDSKNYADCRINNGMKWAARLAAFQFSLKECCSSRS